MVHLFLSRKENLYMNKISGKWSSSLIFCFSSLKVKARLFQHRKERSWYFILFYFFKLFFLLIFFFGIHLDPDIWCLTLNPLYTGWDIVSFFLHLSYKTQVWYSTFLSAFSLSVFSFMSSVKLQLIIYYVLSIHHIKDQRNH